jgi:hypothetical protein
MKPDGRAADGMLPMVCPKKQFLYATVAAGRSYHALFGEPS